MATNLTNLIDDVQLDLAGFTYRQDRATYLINDISTTDLTLKVASTDNIGKGIIEIEDEMLWVDSYDRQSNTITIAPYGRGYNGTTAAAHTANTKITIAPTYPRQAVKRAINDTINSVYPKVYSTGSSVVSFLASRTTYAVPAEAIQLLSMAWESVGPTKEWLPIRQWRWDPIAYAPTFPTGKTVSIYDNVLPGRNINIVYSHLPVALTNPTDDFETVSGLPTSMRDVIIYGASWRLASFFDPARNSITSPQSDEIDNKRPYGTGANVTRQLQTLYLQRLEEESLKQKLQYPTRVHYGR
jgi:hypothetical protein